ncbi:MAG TPA: ergothioneine biosynthesis protein EgtB [Acidimicrobiales bacterium]|nr:ergothioneine biosynthesis protein EgtB [Acidimicrobiales bacterium]
MTDLLTTAQRADLLASRYAQVRGTTETLAAPLSPEDQTVQSMPDVSPTKWHRAHTSWFFETFLLEPSLAGYRSFHPAYAYLFNSYYEGVGARYPRPRRGVVSRPGVGEVTKYRDHVDAAMARLLREPLDPAATDLVELGLHHEQQHQELLLMDIKHVLSCNPLQPAYATVTVAEPASAPPALRWVEHEGGMVEVGHDGNGFAFDNERPRHGVYLEPFALADRAVTCGEWTSFIDDGGYDRPDLWLSDGWATAQAEGWDAPLYWFKVADDWWLFTLGGPQLVDPSEPVCHVSYYEADAFARWRGARLPTESEWETVAATQVRGGARVGAGSVGAGSLGAGSLGAGSVVGNFLDPAVLHPRPSTGAPSLFGDVWQWTRSAYSPYPGFQPAAGAVGEYNGKFMVNQYVLRGGCCVTPADHIRPAYRNFFPPSARWAFAGLRLARDS